MRLPTLFVSHGSPMLAVEPGRTGPALAAFSESLPEKPKGILVVSPHWMRRGLAVSTRDKQEAWHDFGGFPAVLYSLRYDAPGSPALAARVARALGEAGMPVADDGARPLDHGAWVPLRYLYPQADIPVVQLSLDAERGPAELYALGQALAPLRDEGILIIGSGSLTHNLRWMLREQAPQAAVDHTRRFQQWFADHLAAGDVRALLDWDHEAPEPSWSHPTDEHLMPIFVAMGAGGFPAVRVNDELLGGVAAMDAYAFNAAPTGQT